MTITPPVVRLHGTPCTVCWLPARELVMFSDVHVVVHMTGDRQQPCRIPAPAPTGQDLPQPPARPRPAPYRAPTGRPVRDVRLPEVTS